MTTLPYAKRLILAETMTEARKPERDTTLTLIKTRMDEQFLNPITLSFALLKEYSDLVRENLRKAGLQPAEIDSVINSLEVDRGLFLSLNRKYLSGDKSFRQFCCDYNLSPYLADSLGWFDNQHLYVHQEEAIRSILADRATIVSTGTGSGKTESFLIPILDHCLKNPGPGVKALIIYPMNALANDQLHRMRKALDYLNEAVAGVDLSLGLFTGPTSRSERDTIRRNPPDILITNYVMLDWMLMRSADQPIFAVSKDTLRFIVLDEIHTYRGNKATHLKYLLARLKALLNNRPVQIGTSATLRTANGTGDDDTRLDRFIKLLLEVDTYRFIEPTFEPETHFPMPQAFIPIPDERNGLGWAMQVDVQTGLRNLEQLLGRRYSDMDSIADLFWESSIYRDLQQNPFVQSVRQALAQGGACSFTELVGLLNAHLPASFTTTSPEDIAKAYLSAVAFLNFQSQSNHDGKESRPLLDFRAHLFIRQVSGYLKRCIKCHRYHSGSQEFCQDCGFPLFCVYRGDIDHCVGKVSGNRLRWNLQHESDDRKNSFYVLIAIGSATEEDMGFVHDSVPHNDEIILNYDVYGELRLKLLNITGPSGVYSHLVPLADDRQPIQYLQRIVQSILDFEPARHKSLLGFIDNRERASRYGSVLRDEFASQFLEEFLKLNFPQGRRIDPLNALMALKRQTPDELSPVEQAIFAELDLWYWRLIGAPPRRDSAKNDLLILKHPDDFSEFERELLDIFLAERALVKPSLGDYPDSQYIRLRKYLALNRMGIHCEIGHGSRAADYASISLAENAREYQDFVVQHGADRIRQTIHDLTEQGILKAVETPDKKIHYYLDTKATCLQVAPAEVRDYHELRERFLLTADVHSSEVGSKQREQRETEFKKGQLNCLIATPTLEMGIDIGKLQNVLMIGVPPLPSNYAQRAGRAGRGQRGNFALLVTFCQEDNDHDQYFFLHPKQMIDGVISPPAFNPANSNVIRKHVNAVMLAGHADSKTGLNRFCAGLGDEVEGYSTGVEQIFGVGSGAMNYARTDFAPSLRTVINQMGRFPLFDLYNSGFLPDYLFRRDQVYLIDGEKAGLVNAGVSTNTSDLSPRQLSDFALSEREPELAYRLFAPEESLFIAGEAYTVSSYGKYYPVECRVSIPVRSYQWLAANKQVRYASKDREHRKYDHLRYFLNDQSIVDKRKVLGITHYDQCRLLFINKGYFDHKGFRPFIDEAGAFGIGYEIQREALLLRFDDLVCSDPRIYLSLLSVLDRTIKERFDLAEGELGLLTEVIPEEADINERPGIFAAFYDASDNGNIPLKQAFVGFDDLVALAYDTMMSCRGNDGQGCQDGCYKCTRSYGTRHFTASVDKQYALMFTGYLLGKCRFVPAIKPMQQAKEQFDLVLHVKLRSRNISVAGPSGLYTASVEKDQNSAVFNLLTQSIQAEFREGMKGLEIIAKGYLVDAINRGTVEQGREAFARLQFNLLRFQYVKAEKG